VNPRVAARNTYKRIEALASVAEFVRSYRLAWAARRAGKAGVVFPAGTHLRKQQGPARWPTPVVFRM
jgi:hypothetical protein